MLHVSDLHVSVNDHPVLKGLTLQVNAGEVHAIMGPNGSGKTTLGRALSGHPAFTVTKGTATLAGKDLLLLEPEERSHAGLFVSWQYPVEVPGVSNADFLRLAYNAQRKAHGKPEVNTKDFPALLAQKIAEARIPPEFGERQLNAGMSGGQKKRNEILQLHMLEPTVAILDETDSGLDIDALKSVGDAINAYRRADRAIVLITHFQRLLDLVKPDRVHVLTDGRIQQSGDVDLAGKLERDGYDWIVRG
ncbi:MAG: Fe-S cluster assembly ATPase SufC [Planctomycetes bacterium]|nr:Fe-S cluster assembly ATPase SufC [Planctomycetota bacterium]